MRYILNKSTNPFYNLALDEYAMTQIDVDEDFFILWQNEPSIIIGKNQNTLEEINQSFVKEKGIHVARRVSGGGAVYHDFGNLNFTFVIRVSDPKTVNYKKYVQPIVDALAVMGIEAEATGRNDVHVNGLKISGNAQRMAQGRLMHHGTILFDVDIETMVQALTVDPEKYRSKGSKSVRSRVTNIKEHLPENTTLEMFWDQLHYELSSQGQDAEIILTDAQKAEVQARADALFSTWDWVYGTSPASNVHMKTRFPGGSVEVLADVEAGRIVSIRFQGDYLGLKDVQELEKQMVGLPFDITSISAFLASVSVSDYFGSITQEELIELLFGV